MKKRVFLKCFLIALFSSLIVFLFGVAITYLTTRSLINERLITDTEMVSSLIDGEEDFSALEEFSQDNIIRITVISLSGEVLYESDTDEQLENHIDRDEVVAAISGTPYTVERYSNTFRCNMAYYAAKTEFTDGESAVVRLAVRSADMYSYLISAMPLLLITLIISALVALLFAKRLSSSTVKQITDISDSIRSLSSGSYMPLDLNRADKEFASVYGEINELNEKILLYMKNEEYEREKLAEVLEAEKALVRQKEEFFANASHELKTPLTAMVGLTELILARETDEVTHRQTKRIHKESLRLSVLISDMLKLSMLEGDIESPPGVEVSVREIAAEVLAELSESIKEKSLNASVSGVCKVMADEKRIYEILQNLISNAVNYNKQNGLVEVILEEKNGFSSVTVRDSGIGIAEENIPHLCERFYRVDKSRSKKTGGTGLGLAIVKHVCALYNAKFTIKSKLGEGTEVTVAFDNCKEKAGL